MAIKYDNFDLLIERSGDEFKARVLESPAGEATTHFHLPYTETEIENFYIQIGHTRLIESSEMQKMRLFGQELFEATFTENVRDKFRESLAEVNRKREGLRIRLRLSDVPELANMPWEFMYDSSLSRFLTLSIETPLVRYLDVPRDIQPLTIRPPLSILVVISSPRNFPTLNVQREWENLREALQGLESRGLVKLTKLEKPTLQALQRQLRRGEYHIFHFIGHGIFSKHLQDGQLLFEDEIKGGDPVSSRDLGIILHDHKQLRLAVLNACEGARTSLEDQFSGTAQSLMLQGLPAVIAMQFRITDIAAITMAREFYSALADGYPVDASLTEARKSIKTHGNELEWGTPVLYMRSPDGAIFDVKNLPPRPPVEKPIASIDQDKEKRLTALYTEGLEAYYLKEWERAISKFESIIDEQPGYKDAVAKLEFAQKSLDLASLDKQAKAAETEGKWVAAVEVLEKILKDFPEQETFSQRLKHAQKQKHLSSLYDEARQLAQVEKWETVVHVFNELHTQDPHYPDPENLLAQAEKVVKAEKAQRELETLYRNALEAINNGHWRRAVKSLQRVRKLQSGYRETDLLLKRAETELAQAKERKSSLNVTANAPNLEGFFLAAFGSFGLARILTELALGGKRFDWFSGFIGQTTTFILLTFLLGALMGVSCWWGLTKISLRLNRMQTIGFFISFAFAISAPLSAARIASFTITDEWIWVVSWTLSGLLVGLILSLCLQKVAPGFGQKQFWFNILGWGIAFFIGQQIGNQVSTALPQSLHDNYLRNAIGSIIEAATVGLIGSSITLYQLQSFQNFRVDWKVVGIAALGFTLGNALLNTIYKSGYETKFGQLFFWGLIGGACLAYPSKDFKRYLIFGCCTGLGIYLGYQAHRFLNYSYYTATMSLTLGMLLGIILWIETKKPLSLPILLVIIFLAFTFQLVLYRWVANLIYLIGLEKIIRHVATRDIIKSALSVSILGAALGATWTMLTPKSSRQEQR